MLAHATRLQIAPCSLQLPCTEATSTSGLPRWAATNYKSAAEGTTEAGGSAGLWLASSNCVACSTRRRQQEGGGPNAALVITLRHRRRRLCWMGSAFGREAVGVWRQRLCATER